MNISNIKVKIIIMFIFIISNIITYYFLELNQSKSINLVKQTTLSDYQTRLDILFYNQKKYSNLLYRDILTTNGFLDLLTRFETANVNEQIAIRQKLINLLDHKYKMLKSEGINILQFVNKDNISILRMHKPEKFGDDLTNIRDDFISVNKNQKMIRVFSQGRTTHGFRSVYPIFGKNGTYLGAMEISFSSDSLQDYFLSTSQTHTHFLVDKKIFNQKYWNNIEFANSPYSESKESRDYLIYKYTGHYKIKHILDSDKLFTVIKAEMTKNIDIGNSFAIYKNLDKNRNLILFLPIKNIEKSKNLAWVVIYQTNDSIYRIIKSHNIIKIVFIFLYIFLAYIIYYKLVSQIQMKEEHYLLNDILNSTNAMMFVTNFKKLAFSNKEFQVFFDIQDESQYEQNILYLFADGDSYISSKNLRKNESFYDLIERTPSENRTVSVLNKTFHISATKTSYNRNKDGSDYCLVTLTDITKRIEIEKEMTKKAYMDSLTGVPNRNRFNEVAEKQFSIDSRYKEDLTVAILDIDHFKKFNDTYGHLIGDEVLIMLAQHMQKSVRTADTFARWGGEEFVLLFPKTDKDTAKVVCDKLRIEISELTHPVAGHITASFGIAQYQDGDTLKTMFKRCDDALYKAKENGRNQVVII